MDGKRIEICFTMSQNYPSLEPDVATDEKGLNVKALLFIGTGGKALISGSMCCFLRW